MPATPPLPASNSRLDRGKIVVLGIFGVALALAAFAWWWNVNQNRRARAFWGQDNVRLIRTASHVELWELAPATETSGDEAEQLTVDGAAYQVASRQDLADARGLVHARYALTDDASFDWEAKDHPDNSPTRTPDWRWAIKFQEESGYVTILIDVANHQLRCAETGKQIFAIPRIVSGWQALAERERSKK